MAEKIAILSTESERPNVEISIRRDNGFLRTKFRILVYDKTDTIPTLVGTNGNDVDQSEGNYPIPNDFTQLDNCLLRYRVSVSTNDGVVSKWFLHIRITQNSQIVEGGNISYEGTLDAFDVFGDKVRFKVQ